MAPAWKAAGITYNRYLAIAARAVRQSLKEDKRLHAERRGEMDLKVAKWSNGKVSENKELHTENQKQMENQAPGQSSSS